MKRLLLIVVLCLCAGPVYSTTFFADPLGSGTTCTSGSPCAFATALSGTTGPVRAGDTLCLTKGVNKTYTGKFSSTLVGNSSNPITVRSCDATGSAALIHPADAGWATIDGYWVTTLATALNTTRTDPMTIVLAANVGFGNGVHAFIANADGSSMEEFYLGHTGSFDGVTWNNCAAAGGFTAVSHAIGSLVYLAGDVGTIQIATGSGSYVYWRDFEVTNNNPIRAYNSSLIVKQVRGPGIYVLDGDHGKFINLMLHDNQEGMYIAVQATNTEVYGVVLFNGGYNDWTRGHGQGLYMANDTGQKQVRNIISFNGFSDGMKGYAESGTVKNFLFEHVVSSNNGVNESFPGNTANGGAALAATSRTSNLYAGTGSSLQPLVNILVHDTYLYHPLDAKPGSGNLGLGYQGRQSTGLEITNSRIMGGNNTLELAHFVSYTVTGNKFYEQTTSLGAVFNEAVDANMETGYSGTWNTNTYFTQQPAQPTLFYPFRFAVNNVYTSSFDGGTALVYTHATVGGNGGWKENSGLDASGSSWTNSTPSGDEVFVIPNEFEPGRGHGVCYNWSHASTCSFNLSTLGLVDGQTVYAYAGENPLGAAIATITYNAASPSSSISTAGTTVAAPVGNTASIANGGMNSFVAATTRPEFLVVLFIGGPQSAGPPDPPTNLAASLGTSTGVTLTWSNASGGTARTGTVIDYSTDGTVYSNATTTSSGATSYTFIPPTPKIHYWFRIRATGGGGSSANIGPVNSDSPVISGYCVAGPNCPR